MAEAILVGQGESYSESRLKSITIAGTPTPTATPTATPTGTPTATPTPTITPTPAPSIESYLYCLLPRIFTQNFIPRIATKDMIPRISCLLETGKQ